MTEPNEGSAIWSAAAEMSVLGGMMLDPDAAKTAAGALTAEDFFRPANRVLFAAMVRLVGRKEAIDATTLAEDLTNAGELGAVGGLKAISPLIDAVPSAANIAYHIGIVSDRAARRRLAEACTEGITLARSPEGKTAEEVQAEVAKKVAGAAGPARGGALIRVKDVLWPVFEDMEKIGTDLEVHGVRTGVKDVDRMIGGMNAGDLVIVAGRPSMGKSGFLICNVAADAAITQGLNVLVFSPETKRKALVSRILAAEARVNIQQAKRAGGPKEDEYARLATAAGYLDTARIYVDDTSGISPAAMRNKARKFEQEVGPIGLIIGDYLQKFSSPGAKSDFEEVTQISKDLKDIAMEFSAPYVAGCQLSRAVEMRPDKRPMMSDLRQSGQIEQEADVIMMLYREEYYEGPTKRVKGKKGEADQIVDLAGRAEIIVAKQRDGATGRIPVAFTAEWTKFYDLTPDYR